MIAIVLLLAIAALVFLILFLAQNASRGKAEKKAAEAEQEAAALRVYQGILDAEGRAKEVVAEAEVKVQASQVEAEKIVSDAKAKAKTAEEKAAMALESATATAQEIVDNAKKRAEEIAGDAIAAKGKSEEYERTEKAMRNIITGYGDEYLIPNHSVIDDLAEDFSHKDAGQRLKTARTLVRQMIKQGQAATCDYAEKTRRETAIHFVLDAFIGKVDSILSSAKTDNYGKLNQEINDAFSLVNHNGKAFRDARILRPFLNARIDELRWLVAVNELKLKEREEQRQIKEAMREEEKARRDYEKAIKQAEKEERMLKKAMEEARKQLMEAAAEERQSFQQKLEALQVQLEEAEAKNQRAISMAQQTRRGHVYVISNVGSFGEDVIKIGLTRRLEPLDRVKELGDASVPFEFDVHAMIHSEDAPTLETDLHKRFHLEQINKVNPRKEFFKVKIADIRATVEELGIEAKWTMKAEAREYRESLAMSKNAVGGV